MGEIKQQRMVILFFGSLSFDGKCNFLEILNIY